MIELNLPTPQGYAGHRLVVCELDYELEEGDAPEPKEPAAPTDIGLFIEAVKNTKKKEFTSQDFSGWAPQAASRYLSRLAKRGQIVRTERALYSGKGKPFRVYEKLFHVQQSERS